MTIKNPNSSGQGEDDEHIHNPYHLLLTKYGYKYSHTTPVHCGDNIYYHHTYKRGMRNVGVTMNHSFTAESSTGTYKNSSRTIFNIYDLHLGVFEKHLKRVTREKKNVR